MPTHRVYGIRHHGPGSARALQRALLQQQPDLILVEGPPDANAFIEYVAHPDMQAPVALLLYNPKDFSQAVYYPFAEFSPEWQAMLFGLQYDIPVQFMDLPQAIHFGLDLTEQNNQQLKINLPKESSSLDLQFLQDPLGAMAKIAGYSDSERWWEQTFEQSEGFSSTFDAVLEMISALRSEIPPEQSPHREQLREAYMRKIIRKSIKDGAKNIAIICGAWHAPVLHDFHQFKISRDNALLKGLKKVKTNTTWIPWSFDRLARQSGYRAGIHSPAWYALLFSERKETVLRWMTQAARLLREEHIDTSAAHAIEAVRLAQTLAALRGLSIVGIDELFEAANTVLGEGQASRMDLVRDKLIVGDCIGRVPDSIPVVPLQQDLEQCIKKARLSKERNSSASVEKKLDLRKPTNLLASHLLHRLLLLDIPWGKELAVSKFNTGSFTENWQLKWLPDFVIKIIEAGMWGNTVEQAATALVVKKGQSSTSLSRLTKLLEQCLKANLVTAIDILIPQLQNASALTKDVLHLMDALSPLVRTLRYGSIRNMDLVVVEDLIDHLIPRICIGLPSSCIGIDEDFAENIAQKIIVVHQAINTLHQKTHTESWLRCLHQISLNETVQSLLQGTAVRILMNKRYLSSTQVAQQMRLALSVANDRQKAVTWMEGFLHGSGLLLIHNPSLWKILDDWIAELPMKELMDVLPLLRRTFSKFSTSERQKMMAMANQRSIPNQQVFEHSDSNTNTSINERSEIVLPTIRLLLGKES